MNFKIGLIIQGPLDAPGIRGPFLRDKPLLKDKPRVTKNEQELFQSFLNPENMSNMFQSINSIMENKMKDGKINHEKLQKEAELVQNQVSKLPMMDQLSSIDPSKFNAPGPNKKKKKKKK